MEKFFYVKHLVKEESKLIAVEAIEDKNTKLLVRMNEKEFVIDKYLLFTKEEAYHFLKLKNSGNIWISKYMDFKILEDNGTDQKLECPDCKTIFNIDIKTNENLIWDKKSLAFLSQCPNCKKIEF